MVKYGPSLLSLALLATTWALIGAQQLAPREPATEPRTPASVGQITIKTLGGGSRLVEFCETETVGQLKARVAQLEGLNVENFNLIYGGKELRDNEFKLGPDCGIHIDSQVILVDSPNVGLSSASQRTDEAQEAAIDSNLVIQRLVIKMPAGEIFEMPASNDLTIGELKKLIATLKRVIPADDQLLNHNGLVLDQDQKTLNQFGILNGATIQVKFNVPPGPTIPIPKWLQNMKGNASKTMIKLFLKLFKKSGVNANVTLSHKAEYANVEFVRAMMLEFIKGEIQAKYPQLTPFADQIYNSNDLKVQFGYTYRGERATTVANMKVAAEWIAKQAQVIIDLEAKENQLAITRAPSESSADGNAKA